jgi:hypothetical protein
VFPVNIMRRFLPSLTNVVSGGRFVHYALIGGAQEETDPPKTDPLTLQTAQTLKFHRSTIDEHG